MATQLRQDFLLQPYIYAGSDEIVWDFPLDDFYVNGVLIDTPYGNSDNQHKIDICEYTQGALKQFPLIGFGVFQYQDSEYNLETVYNNLSSSMKMDKYNVTIGVIKPNGKNGFTINTDLITNSY
jgi:tRNA G10  N-methylase Trm11